MVDGRVLDDPYHGIGRITSALLPELAGRPELDVTVVTRVGQQPQRFDLVALTDGLGLRRVEFDHDLTSVGQFLAWPRLLRSLDAEVALFPYNLGASLAGPGRRYAVVHDCIIEADPRFSPDRRTRLLYRMLTAMVVRRTTVLTPSRASAAALRRFYRVGVPDERVLSWGVDPSFARTAPRPVEIQGRAIPPEYYLHVGARRPHKNVQVLVRALARSAWCCGSSCWSGRWTREWPIPFRS